MEERHDAFIYGYRLAATSQDPYLSCKSSLIAQLKARQAASAQAEPVTLAAAPAAQTSLGLAADDEAIVGAPARRRHRSRRMIRPLATNRSNPTCGGR
jgi:hypothetical protein